MFNTTPCFNLERATLTSWGHIFKLNLGENLTFLGAGTDLNGPPGLVGEELHWAGGSCLDWGSKQEIQLCGVDFLVHEENLQFGEK